MEAMTRTQQIKAMNQLSQEANFSIQKQTRTVEHCEYMVRWFIANGNQEKADEWRTELKCQTKYLAETKKTAEGIKTLLARWS